MQGRRESVTGQLASANLFDALGVHPDAGRLFQATDDRPGAEPVVPALLAGICLGIAGYLAAGRLIRSELFGVTSGDPAAAAAAVAALMAIATASVWIPTRRATRIDPTDALRYDHA